MTGDQLIQLATSETIGLGGGPAPGGPPRVIRVHPADDVAVAVGALVAGGEISIDGTRITARDAVPAGHKIALRDFQRGEPVIKYGFVIGQTTEDVPTGSWIHSHNLRTNLEGTTSFEYAGGSRISSTRVAPVPTFDGYRRANGSVGTRNELWILNTVGCVNHAAERIAKVASERFDGRVDGIHTFTHPYGCSQLGDDLGNTQKILAGLMRHPNAGGVLVLGLGCENNQMDALLALAGDMDRERMRSFNSQEVGDEIEAGVEAVEELIARMEHDRRTSCPASSLVLGHKCGGSDGFSGISANALLGRIADRLTGMGGAVLLTEVPEMFGAERVLLDRAVSEDVFRDGVAMVDDFKEYFVRHGQPIYENPSPGNKAGGLTTLEEKSLGAVQKGGRAAVTKVLRYGQQWRGNGLALLEAPGNDAVSSTAMVASGATILLFTTGRGTPLGFPVPTLKVSSNSAIASKKPHWIDFNAGKVLDGDASMEQLEDALFALILDTASGKRRANNETHGYREIAIWKEGVTL